MSRRRHDKQDDFGWQAPVNLGSGVNSVAADLGPALFMDSETETLTFTFTRPGPGPGAPRALASVTSIAAHSNENGEFTPAVLVSELSTCFEDEQPAIRRTGSSCSSSLIVWAVSAQGDIWVSNASEHGGSVVVPGELGVRHQYCGHRGTPGAVLRRQESLLFL